MVRVFHLQKFLLVVMLSVAMPYISEFVVVLLTAVHFHVMGKVKLTSATAEDEI